jgi:hypothetical protein
MGFLDRMRKRPKTAPELDRLMLRDLKGAGADLTRPRHVIHYLYFADEAVARRAASVIESGGYDVSLTPPTDEIREWSVRAESTRVVDETTVDAFRAWFEEVAADHGGEYDGWEAAAQP